MVIGTDKSYISIEISVNISIESNKVKLIKSSKVISNKGVLKLVREAVNKSNTASFLIIASIINIVIEI